MQQQAIWINDFGDSCVYTTVEPTSWKVKNNKGEDYIHKSNEKPFCEERKWYKTIKSTIAETTKISTMLEAILVLYPRSLQ